jgi:hypothetical protein
MGATERRMTWFAVVVAVLSVVSSRLVGGTHPNQRVAGAGAVARQSSVASPDTMIDLLGSPSPNPALGNEARTFDRLVGAWDADFSFRRDDGTVYHKKGEIRFGWVMDGRAIQDLWVGYPSEGQKDRSIGTTFRFFDTKLNLWRIVFIKSPIQLRGHCPGRT